MRVQDLMDTTCPFIYSDELTTRARAVLRERGLRVLPVVDERKRVVGMISRSEVMALTSSVSPIRVKGVMSTHSQVITPDMEIVRTLREMIRTDQWYAPVVERGKPVGIVTQQDLLESGSLLLTFEDRKGRFKSPSKISAVMKTSLAVLRPTDVLKDAAILLSERNIGRVLIIDDREDVVKALIRI